MLEPRSGRFWRELSPGDDVQAAVNKCPEGGCILLRPGVFALAPQNNSPSMAGLSIDTPVSIFGRSQATVHSPGSAYTVDITEPSVGTRSLISLDGLVVQSLVILNNRLAIGVSIYGGSSRLQSCVLTGPNHCALRVMAVRADYSPPVIINCRCGSENRLLTNGVDTPTLCFICPTNERQQAGLLLYRFVCIYVLQDDMCYNCYWG